MIRRDAKSVERRLETPRGGVGEYVRSVKESSEEMIRKELESEMKDRFEKKKRELNFFVVSNLRQEAHKVSGLRLFNLRAKEMQNPKALQNARVNYETPNNKASSTTRNNLKESTTMILSLDSARSLPELSVTAYVDEQVKSMKEELLKKLSEKLDNDIENALDKIKSEIMAANQSQFKELAKQVKNKLVKHLNKKPIFSSKETFKQLLTKGKIVERDSADGKNVTELQQSGLKSTVSVQLEESKSRNNRSGLRPSHSSYSKEGLESVEKKKLLKIITSYQEVNTSRTRQKLLNDESKDFASSEYFLTYKVSSAPRGLNQTQELTEYKIS
eukprot:TRINITY_DN9375_c0_g3_i2.p1 TRINITY_DN9375_c0_g3~~TRINITY_DN9375_c0_g3_i2.p1  ORF type:complete len:330 (-),score=49.60 TRINITY_DN9375_c0_g3_i2:1728-2717(-)